MSYRFRVAPLHSAGHARLIEQLHGVRAERPCLAHMIVFAGVSFGEPITKTLQCSRLARVTCMEAEMNNIFAVFTALNASTDFSCLQDCSKLLRGS